MEQYTKSQIQQIEKEWGFYHPLLNIGFQFTRDGWLVKMKKTVNNYALILDYKYPNAITRNSFTDTLFFIKDNQEIIMQNKDFIGLTVELERFTNDTVNIKMVEQACILLGNQHSFNPFSKLFADLPPTTTNYLNNWLTLVFGADDTPLTRVYGRKWLMAAVARALDPKEVYVEGALILYGQQADWKTYFFKNINLRPEYYCGSKVDLSDTRRAALTYAGKHICELNELTQFAKMEESDVKQFLTQTGDTFDKKYENQSTTVKRGMIFGGSTNSNDFLKDYTGSRRFWVVETHGFNVEKFREIKDALWYEAYQAYLTADRNQATDPWVLTKEEIEMCNENNKRFATVDVLAQYVYQYIYQEHPADNNIKACDINDYLKGKQLGYTDKRVSEILQHRFKWEKKNQNDGVHYLRPAHEQLVVSDVKEIENEVEAFFQTRGYHATN